MSEGGHRLVASRRGPDGWREPVVVTEGESLFVNWADVPVAAEAPDGTLWLAWPAKIGSGTYAYSIFLARSADGGASWEEVGALPDDDSPTEHGFPAFTREGRALRAVWLDGREMLGGGPMTLRSRVLSVDGSGSEETRGPEEVLDDRVCECCPVDAATVSGEPLVVYRNRSELEVRDPWSVRRTEGAWSDPSPVARDSWQIAGCPVNGPSVAAAGDTVVVVWFTAASGSPAVEAAVSLDRGATWGDPRLVDGSSPVGRVAVVMTTGGAARVLWLGGGVGELAEVRLAGLGADGSVGPARVLGRTAAGRASGYPRLVRWDDRLAVVWREVTPSGSQLRFAELPEDALPPV